MPRNNSNLRYQDSPLHSAMIKDLSRSGITARDAKQSKFRILTAAEAEGANLPYPTDVYEIPYHDLDGKPVDFIRYRHLVLPGADGSASDNIPKYQQLKGTSTWPYFPKVVRDWRVIEKNSERDIAFVEGEKKSIACSRALGIPTVGLGGKDSWRSSKQNLGLISGLHDFVWKGRKVYICFDGSHPANPTVQHAAYSFALLLISLGAATYIISIPPFADRKQTGPDDFLIREGVAALKKLFKDTPRWKGFPLTDQGNAERFAHIHGEELRCVGRADQEGGGLWYHWNGKYWAPDEKLSRQRRAQLMPETMREEAVRRGANSKELSNISAQCSARSIMAAMKLARSIPPIPIQQQKFDDTDHTGLLLNTENGTLELPNLGQTPTVKLRLFDRGDLITKCVRAPYVSDASARRWERFVLECAGEDPLLVRTLQQLVGLSLTGITSKHLFIIMRGDGQTGKTTFQEALQHLLGGYAGSIPSDHLVVQRNNTNDERRAVKLVGLRFVTSNETKQGGVLDESFVKLITGGDTLAARYLYRESFDFKPQSKLWLRTNYKLTIRGQDNGIWRRIVQIPFTNLVKTPDAMLPHKLRREGAGILAWAIRGWLDYVKNGDLFLAPAIKAEIEAYRREQDTIGQFLEEECEVLSPSRCPEVLMIKQDLYRRYRAWSENRNHYAKNDQAFAEEIRKNRIAEKRTTINGRREYVWINIAFQNQKF